MCICVSKVSFILFIFPLAEYVIIKIILRYEPFLGGKLIQCIIRGVNFVVTAKSVNKDFRGVDIELGLEG